jgi:hypothetical protein
MGPCVELPVPRPPACCGGMRATCAVRGSASRVRSCIYLSNSPAHRRVSRRLNLHLTARIAVRVTSRTSPRFDPCIGAKRSAQPRQGDQPLEPRIERRRQRHLIDAPPSAVVKLHEFDRVPARDARPAEDSSRAIGEARQIRGLDRRLVRGSREHALQHVPQPWPALRREARAALIGIPAAGALALAVRAAAPAPTSAAVRGLRAGPAQVAPPASVRHAFVSTLHSFEQHSFVPAARLCARVLLSFASRTRIEGWRSAERRTDACEASVGPALTGQARHLARRLASPNGGRPPPGAPPWRFWAPVPRFLHQHLRRIRAASSSQPGRTAWRAGSRAGSSPEMPLDERSWNPYILAALCSQVQNVDIFIFDLNTRKPMA